MQVRPPAKVQTLNMYHVVVIYLPTQHTEQRQVFIGCIRLLVAGWNLSKFTTEEKMEQPDERLWELEICLCDDGDILIEQGRCWSCDESLQVRLHRSQIPLVAELGGFVPAGDVARATEQMHDRLSLLASLVRAHTKTGDPLRIVVDDLIGGFPSKPVCSPLEASSLLSGDGCLPSAAGCGNGHPGQPNGDLFADRAGEKQNG